MVLPPGFEPGSPARKDRKIDYKALREDFIKYLHAQGLSDNHIRDVVSYLDRFVSGRIISSPKDAVEIISNCPRGRRHLIKSLRLLIKYSAAAGIISKQYASELLDVLHVPRAGIDIHVPSDDDIISAYEVVREDPIGSLLFRLLCFSGIRLREAVEMINNFDETKLYVNDVIARYTLAMSRKTKNVYYAYFPSAFVSELRKIEISYRAAEKKIRISGVAPKYLRKWNYNFLISRGVPESVADFIQGRAPLSVGSMHYLARVRQADEWYAKVAPELWSLLGK
ncbi:MAG: integrase [Candidatus Methanospirareceae archaeon]